MIESVERYIEMRVTLGYTDQDLKRCLRGFATFASERGSKVLLRGDIICWIGKINSNYQKRRHLDWIEKFGSYMRAENDAHESMPSKYADRLGKRSSSTPFIYRESEILRIMDGFGSLGIHHPYDVATYRTIVGLIASTGMRLGEALSLCKADFKELELLIRKGKFGKDRLLYVQSTTGQALREYLEARPATLDSSKIFVIHTNRTPASCTVQAAFRRCTNYVGVDGREGSGPPRIHDLRHTFAVNSLRDCSSDERSVSNHIVALSTYLGHVSVSDTYWYLRLLPETKLMIAKAISEPQHAQ